MEVKTIAPPNAQIMLVGEMPGKVEIATGTPFMGETGVTLRKMLTQAGIFYGDCIISNVCNINIKKLYEDKKCTTPTPEFAEQIQRLKKEIETYNPNIIVALGTVPMQVLCDVKGIDSYRGTILPSTLVPGKKVLVTQHPKATLFDYTMFYIMTMDFRKVQHEMLSPDLPDDSRTYDISPSKQKIISYLEYLLTSPEVEAIAIDLEHVTPGAHISWLGITHSPNYAMSIEFINKRSPCFPLHDEVQIWSLIAAICSSGIPLVFHNGSYDATNLWHNQGVWCKNIAFDTFIAMHTIWPEFPKDLGFSSSILLNNPAWKHTSGKNYEHGLYNAQDVANTMGLYQKLKPMIEADENYSKTFSLVMSEYEPAAFMQLQGVHIDKEEQSRLREEFTAKRKELEDGLSAILNRPINFNSPKQLQELLYNDLGLPVQYKRRKNPDDPRKVTTDSETLEKLYIKTQNPILKLLLEYRKYTKILQFINIETSEEGKIHTSYNTVGTDTGRWSSSASIILDYGSGNLQNIDRRIRTMYVPPPDMPFKTCMLQADYIGAEAHLVAHLINDTKLIKVFDEGGDIHKMTAAFMFNVPLEDVTKELRTIGKSIRHATNYSAGPAVLQSKLKCSLKTAKEYLSRFLAITPQLGAWHERIKVQLQANRTLITPYGRKRIFMERWGDQLFRSAFAMIPQSTIGDLLNDSMVSFYNAYKNETDGALLMQLHDAIYVWCKDTEEDRQKWAARMFQHMHRPIVLPHIDLYIGVDFKWGYNWGDMKPLELQHE